MKVQKLGLVLGMNMAVACFVMQGCKAVKPEKDLPPPSEPTPVIEVQTEPEPQPAPTVPETAPVEQQETPPPAVTTTTVKKLPPPPEVKKPQPPPPPAPVAEATTVHVVQRGEYLAGISKKYNVKLSAIVAANPGLNPDRIRIGQKLTIPGTKSAAKPAVMLAAAPAPAAANTTAPVKVKPTFKAYAGPTKDYVVRNGDSLGKIAYENGITIRALKELNGLTKDIVRIGQKLKIPAEKQVADKKAEKPAADKKAEKPAADKKAEKPAEKKDAAAPAPVPEKKDAAPAPAEVKEPAPAGAAAAPAPAETAAPAPAAEAPSAEAAPAAEPAPAGNTYTVKDGDDIVSISIAWGISPSQLLNANDLKENEPLKPGTVLKLPPNAKQAVQ